VQTGSLLVSCFIIGKNELPPLHKDDEDEETGLLPRRTLAELQKENQGLQVINSPEF
jgi:hypothetical protein